MNRSPKQDRPVRRARSAASQAQRSALPESAKAEQAYPPAIIREWGVRFEHAVGSRRGRPAQLEVVRIPTTDTRMEHS